MHDDTEINTENGDATVDSGDSTALALPGEEYLDGPGRWLVFVRLRRFPALTVVHVILTLRSALPPSVPRWF